MTVKETSWFASQRIEGKVPSHLAFATGLTRFGQLNNDNRLRRRKKSERARTREASVRNMPHKDSKMPFPYRARGAYICRLPV